MMVKRYDSIGNLTIEPPYSPAEQKVLGDKRPFPEYVRAEKYAVSIAFAVSEDVADYDTLSADAHLCDIELVLYFEASAVIGGEILSRKFATGQPIRGRKLERDMAQMLHDVITGTDRKDDPRLL
jgi:hypothetical protein